MQARNWLVCRYPLASMMVIYVVILVLIGFSKTRHFQNFYSKYIKESWNFYRCWLILFRRHIGNTCHVIRESLQTVTLIFYNLLFYTTYCTTSLDSSLYNWRWMMFHPKHVWIKYELQKHRLVLQSEIFSFQQMQDTWLELMNKTSPL